MSGLDSALRELVREVVREELCPALREEFRSALRESREGTRSHPSPGSVAPLLTVEEAANEMKVTPPTIREWIKSGTLRATRVGPRRSGRLLRISRNDLDAFVAQQRGSASREEVDVDDEAARILSGARARRGHR